MARTKAELEEQVADLEQALEAARDLIDDALGIEDPEDETDEGR